MWDKDTPLQLLSTMPKALKEEHLERLQQLLEADKFKNQLLSGADLCGTYAPFCYGCNKETKFPCAVSYINYLKDIGMDYQIAEDAPVEDTESTVEEHSDEQLPEIESAAPSSEVTEEVIEETKAEEEHEKVEEEPKKTKIRIAIARKRIS